MTQQLLFQSSYHFRATTSLNQLLYQNSCFFSAIFFPGQLLVWNETFSNYFFELLLQTKYFNAISSKEAIFPKGYFFRKSIGPRIYFFRRVTSYEWLLSQRSCFYNMRYYLTASLPFHRCTSNRLVIVGVPLTCIDNVKFFFMDLLLFKVIS